MSNFLSDPSAPAPVNVQQDGTQTNMGEKPTKGPLQDRSASPVITNTSGMERAMGALADRIHRRR